MSPDTLEDPNSVVPELATAIAEVDRTFTALRTARAKFNRCSKPTNREAARKAMVQAEEAYRVAATRRDELVEVRNARLTQRGDARGPLWSKPDVDSPVLDVAALDGVRIGGKKITVRRTGYNPKLGPNHPDNRDPTLEPEPVVPRPLAEAPKDATEILAWTTDRYGNRRWLVVHWAQGGGEEQPPFRGWFYNLADGYSEIDPKHILGWLPLPDRKLVKL